MTSRDLTENVEQLQVRASLELIRDRMVAALARLARRAAEHRTLVLAGRSHNVPAQATTMGKRFANAGEELLQALQRVEELLERYPLRGIKGPVGTQQDMADLLGDPGAVDQLEAAVAEHLGFTATLNNVGQVYPRSLDLDVVAALAQAAAAPSSLATTLRLMAGLELATEGFRPGQVGSSAMPHKMNSRSCERICGLAVVIRGHLSMVAELAGDQWNEGDVSCSVVRRVALPDAFLATDGLFETFLTVLDDLGVYPAVIARELDRYLPFLATTKVLVAAVRAGVGRETAHEVISEHAVAAALALREEGEPGNDLLDRLAADPRLPLDRPALDALLADPLEFAGRAPEQVDAFVAQVEASSPATPRRPPTPPPTSSKSPSGSRHSSDTAAMFGGMTLPLPHVHSGKVRDIYAVGDDRLLMVTSDRLSAFDVVMDEPIPQKGRVLTAMSAFWFEELAEVAPSHLVSTDVADLPAEVRESGEDLAGRIMLCRRAEMLPIECIVRGYLSGSAWKEYKRAGTMHGTALPTGLQESEELPEPVFTPSTKADEGHDENISFEAASDLVGADVAAKARDISLELYSRGAELARERGIIIADTKFELGFVDGELAVCDEVLTPDSSRFWPVDEWKPGVTPPSFDKQPVRDYLDGLDWDKQPPPPPLPPEVVNATSARYVEAYERITGRRLAEWAR